MPVVDPPVRANGGVKGFGIDFQSSVKTSMTTDGRIRVTTDPNLPTITKIRVINSGNITQEVPVGGEWEVLFLE